jgi:hypothetical protein
MLQSELDAVEPTVPDLRIEFEHQHCVRRASHAGFAVENILSHLLAELKTSN